MESGKARRQLSYGIGRMSTGAAAKTTRLSQWLPVGGIIREIVKDTCLFPFPAIDNPIRMVYL